MTVGLFLTSLSLGLRHGIDWDHIAAIADLSGSAETRKQGFRLSFLYALGHAAVVFALGCLAILFGAAIPDGLDTWMGRIVGLTLIVLGAWVLVELLRKGRNFRLRSRWMLVIDGTFAGLRRVRSTATGRVITVEHQHGHDHGNLDDLGDLDEFDERADAHADARAHDHAHMPADVVADLPASVAVPSAPQGFRSALSALRDRRHSHSHAHNLSLPDTPDARYGNGTAAGIGMLHGVGVESPTQIAVFVASTSIGGKGVGLVLLLGWVLGLIVANSGLALMAGAGMLRAERNFAVYATLAVIVAVLSIAMGSLFLFDLDVLPALDL